MIVLDFSTVEGDTSRLEMIISQKRYTYPDILKITGEFQILIDERIFFSEPYFPILEFLRDALAWIDCSDKSQEMSYSSVEVENNPLIVFSSRDEGWIIRSPWEKCACLAHFTRDELENAILDLVKKLKPL